MEDVETVGSMGSIGSMARLEIVLGDITLETTDVIVSSASPSLQGTAGVEAAIHRRGGPSILEEARRVSALCSVPPIVGTVIPTEAGRLPARWLLHVFGPDYGAEEAVPGLARAYRECVRVAASLGARSLSLPAISTGRRGFPPLDAARVAVRALRFERGGLGAIRVVLDTVDSYGAFVRAFVLEA